MPKNLSRALVLLVVAALIAAFLILDLQHYLSLDYLKQQQEAFEAFRSRHPAASVALFAGIYILVTALSLPGAAVMTLAGAALLGFWTALVVVSIASTIGATLAFIVARFLLHDAVQSRFGDKLKAINEGIRHDGAFYLFGLRLVPVFPFFVINLVMGLTPIRTRTFYWVSQLGMLPGTIVYVNAGTALGRVESAGDILSPGLLLSFTLLGLFPLIAKWLLGAFKRRRALAGWPRPSRFDYNLLVIGGGSAGLVSAYIAATVKARVALVERHRMGGDCLNTGCVPSKTLIRTARVLDEIRRAPEFGLRETRAEFDFAEVMERVRSKIRQVAPHDSAERYTALGVECIRGDARLTGPWSVEVDGRPLTARRIIIATGARPAVPNLPGLRDTDFLTSDSVWDLRERPRRLVVLGGGPIGCELAQAFARLGSHVTLVQRGPRLLPKEDADAAAAVAGRFEREGVTVLTGHAAQRVDAVRKVLLCRRGEAEVEVPFDRLLVALGRTPNTAGLGLEALGVELAPNGALRPDAFMQSSLPTLYCAGDVAGRWQFTHTAAHQAWYAAVNALFGGLKRFRLDDRVIPWATYTDPEVGRVGLNEQEARERGIPVEVTTFHLDDLDRAIVDSEAQGFVKVLTKPGSDRILGATIVGAHAGELIAEFVLAMKHNLGLGKILGTIHVYPTLMEANKYAAGAWKRAHAPERALRWLERYHRWRRGGSAAQAPPRPAGPDQRPR
ncbi:FAD-dependent oxidoreductase [Thioalbus denitrificans]|uniref:Pyruvate/2-oxoglutarate dehydrogenase complex dihydrolipoamide dehydrogenase (E3) component n=1 Tax=Thioalbus denitrificans TaxID=547122 RepID=A0A369C296_9GAMM|nr:FAD-dependent oxidoreductase [Thioalbus denitrificans]RCX28092.1 pyruvate/2-oxoglutarate dehydrogenase complex dihydrolipoamide dehydrogenase (E3) component [Thioalbus denitrificans]